MISERSKEIFIFTKMPRLTLGPTQPTIQWIVGTLLLEGKVARTWSRALSHLAVTLVMTGTMLQVSSIRF